MKRLCLCLALFSAQFLFAQVDVSASLPAKTFLKYEGIPLRIEITNRSGQTLRIGEEDSEDLLILRIRNLDNVVIPRTKKPILNKPWIIASGETEVRTFDLVQLFLLHNAMSYRVLQDVKLAGESYTGKPLLFDISNGQLYEEIKMRKSDRIFKMIGLNRSGGDDVMLRVTNFDETMVLATYFLERHLRFYPPFMKVSKDDEIGTLHYISPHQVVLCRFKPDGEPINRTYYSATPGVPVRLWQHPESGFTVQGAIRREGQSNESTDQDSE